MSENIESVEKEDVNWLNDVKKSREIVTEILRFGVSQAQMQKIIGLLALELEDRSLMIGIRDLLEPSEESESSYENSQTKLVYPGGIENE
jgi:hypothetical protein